MPIMMAHGRNGSRTAARGVTQWQTPRGWLGALELWRMNLSHSKLTDWGLQHVSVEPGFIILDVGCGGGRTIRKLAAQATQGKVYGVDLSATSVAVTRRTNARSIAAGRVEVCQGAVSQLPFDDRMFDLVTAVETHFWWPDTAAGMRDVWRVTRPGGRAILVAEVYKGAETFEARIFERQAARLGATLLSVDEHRELLHAAGFNNVEVVEQRRKGWICAFGRRP